VGIAQLAADAATAAHRDAVRRIAVLLDMKAAAVAAEDFALADKYKQQVSTLRAYQRQAAAATAQQQLQTQAQARPPMGRWLLLQPRRPPRVSTRTAAAADATSPHRSPGAPAARLERRQ